MPPCLYAIFWINATELRWICSSDGFLIELDPIGRILEGHQRNMLECFNYLREGRKPIPQRRGSKERNE